MDSVELLRSTSDRRWASRAERGGATSTPKRLYLSQAQEPAYCRCLRERVSSVSGTSRILSRSRRENNIGNSESILGRLQRCRRLARLKQLAVSLPPKVSYRTQGQPSTSGSPRQNRFTIKSLCSLRMTGGSLHG